LNQRVERYLGPAKPADREAQGNRANGGRKKTPRNAKERGDRVFQEQAMPHQVRDAAGHFHRAWQEVHRAPADGDLPNYEQYRYQRGRPKASMQ
jgi:hypothetical protein